MTGFEDYNGKWHLAEYGHDGIEILSTYDSKEEAIEAMEEENELRRSYKANDKRINRMWEWYLVVIYIDSYLEGS